MSSGPVPHQTPVALDSYGLAGGLLTPADPDGEPLAGPLFGQEGVLHTDLDLSEISRQKFEFDPVGHYARPDVFRLEVEERPRSAVDFRAPDET
jgi:nitrilase